MDPNNHQLVNESNLSRGRVWFWLALICSAALLIRLWGIRFGLPYAYHYDEMFYVTGA